MNSDYLMDITFGNSIAILFAIYFAAIIFILNRISRSCQHIAASGSKHTFARAIVGSNGNTNHTEVEITTTQCGNCAAKFNQKNI
jgi:hypothetical protein